MKKFLLFFVLAFIIFNTNAQVKFGVTGGVNLANVSTDFVDAEDAPDGSIKIGPRIGVTADYDVTDIFTLRSGLLYSSKGYRVNEEISFFGITSSVESTFAVNYLEIPITGVYKAGDFEIMAGPYVAFGIGGKFESEVTVAGVTESEEFDIDFTNEVDASTEENAFPVKGLDVGLTLGAGYNVGPGVVNLFYSMGLSNLTPDVSTDLDPEFDPADESVKNSVIGISFTYFFGM